MVAGGGCHGDEVQHNALSMHHVVSLRLAVPVTSNSVVSKTSQ